MVEIRNDSYVPSREMAVFKLAKRHPFLPSGIVSGFIWQLDYRSVPGVVQSNKILVAPTPRSVPIIKRAYFGTRNNKTAVVNEDMYQRIN